MTAWINGRPATQVDYRDRGLNYGDGVFETMRVRHRMIRLLDYHLERLNEACRRLGFMAPPALRLRIELERIAAKRSDGVMKLIVTRGRGSRGYRPSGRERSTRIVSLQPLPQLARATPIAARVRMCATRIGVSEALAGLKTLNRLDSVLARAEWSDAAVWEGLMRDPDDNIVCGTMSNLFLIHGSLLLTPKVDRCGIAGVMRRWILERAGDVGLRAREDRVRWKDLVAADAAFMTNAVVGVVPVAVVEQGRSRLRFADQRLAGEFIRRLEAL